MKRDLKLSAVRAMKLRDLINDYRYQYHVLNKSIMSEAAADSLKHELSEIEAVYPKLITPDSPTQRVAGEPLPGFQQIRHSQRMLSLNDVFNEDELESWIKRIEKLVPPNTKLEYFLDLKMDGLACALVYEDGILTQGITRGDGFVGEDVTANIRTIESVPLRLRKSDNFDLFLKGRTEIRGEIVMYKSDFAKLNDARKKKGVPLFANPRNLAAGTIRQLDPKLTAARPLQFHAYDILRQNRKETITYEFVYKALRSLGFIANSIAVKADNKKDILKFAEKWEEKRKELDFNTDGLVVKLNNREIFNELGVVGKAPRAAIAYKYPAEQATTKVKDIFVSIGRTGAATPVAVLEPILVAGSTVQMATLHNEGEVHRKDIRIGDTVIIQKAGDIIPEVVRPLQELRTGKEKVFQMPQRCPECNTKLVKSKVTEAIWRCLNDACPSRSWKRIAHYASKSALDIEGLGEKNVIALIKADLIKDAADLYKLKETEILNLERFAEISAKKLIDAIHNKKNPELDRFIYALGIRQIGVQTAIDLAENFKSINSLQKATVDELSQVEGIGEVVAESVVEWFSRPINKILISKFNKYGVQPKTAKVNNGPLTGVSIVVTGSLETMSRDEAAEIIRNLGGTFQSSVGKETTYLVVGANVGESKLTKARKFGTNQIDEKELLKLIQD